MHVIYDHFNTPPGTMTVHHIGESRRLVVWNNKYGIDQYGERWEKSTEEKLTLWEKFCKAMENLGSGAAYAINR